MSTLQVGNLHFESTGNNRLQYTGSNAYNLVAGGTTVATVNTSTLKVVNIDFESNGAIKIPVGTTEQRPSGQDGMLRYNSTTGKFEGHNAAGWGDVTKVADQINTSADTAFVDADMLTARKDSDGSLIKRSWLNVKALIWTALGGLINGGTAKTTPVDGDLLAIADSAASNATKKLSLTDLWANYLKAKADALYIAIGLLTTRGDIIYRGASAPVRLPKGTSGQVLTMGADDPAWETPAGGAVDGYQAVGSYASLQGTAGQVTNPGATRAGSSLYMSGATASGPLSFGGAQPGTWRCHGYGYAQEAVALFIRTV